MRFVEKRTETYSDEQELGLSKWFICQVSRHDVQCIYGTFYQQLEYCLAMASCQFSQLTFQNKHTSLRCNKSVFL